MNGTKPTILAVFGVTGDLSHRKLLPALNQIKHAGQLPDKFKLFGLSRRHISVDDVLQKDCIGLEDVLEIVQTDMESNGSFEELKAKLDDAGKSFGSHYQVIFYFAVPPAAVPKIIENLSRAGLNGPNIKLLLEKPFGQDLESAKELIAHTLKHFNEGQLFRIDHFLAKEGAQNIAVFLGSNALFRDAWSYQFIDKIEIIAAEKIGIEGRVDFYEATGALKDIVQSHLLHLAALVLMEPCPHDFDFAELPERRLRALQQIEQAEPKLALQGQYDSYKKEVDNPKSRTETYVSLVLKSRDSRWRGVEIFLATGKKMDAKLTEIKIHFKKAQAAEANQLRLRIQPNEGIELELWVKKPGYEHELQKQSLSFLYESNYKKLPEAYEQVLIDAMRGNRSLFASSEEVLATWSILQPLIDYWLKGPGPGVYKSGSTVAEVQQALAKQN